jgi:hypothetical protein
MGDVEQRVLVHIPPTRKLAQGIFSAAMGAHLLLSFTPLPSEAGKTTSAMLYTHGAVWLNGRDVPKSGLCM